MEEKKKSVLGSVRLDSDVWEAVRAMDCSLNQYLRASLLPATHLRGVNPPIITNLDLNNLCNPRTSDPASIPGVSVGPPLNAYCVHCSTKFAGAKGASICVSCGRDGHLTSGNCRRCAEIAYANKKAASATGVDDPNIDYDWKDPA